MSPRTPRAGLVVLVFVLALAPALGGCSIKRMMVRGVANSLTSGPDVYGTDDDPDLIKDALPFGLKTMESLLAVIPDHEGLLLTLCKGYTQYAYAFVQSEGDLLVNSDYERANALHERAYKLDLRARDFGLRGLEKRYKGITAGLQTDPATAAARIQARDVGMLYWTAAAWGSAISLGKDKPEMLADLPAIRALMERGLEVDEGYEGGAMHEAMIVLEALPAAMGGSVERARRHFARAVELCHDTKPSPYVTLATSVAILEQNRPRFVELLEHALTFDPDRDPSQRLATIVLQRKARALLEHQDEFFLDDASAPDTTQTPE
ncbi:MAG: TRAP transporter TatT component family protein [Candidatus Eisenbacteria bacterium]|nr:TRAP transporter TatT component family protein [Candidatus Eisenbacteria bacterium]